MLTDLRAELAADLAAGTGVPVLSAWPARITPPCLFVTPPSTSAYVTGGGGAGVTTFGEYLVSADVVCLVPQATPPDIAITALDTLIESVLVNTAADWILGAGGCASPSVVTVNGSEYLGTIVHLSKFARL